MTMRYLIHLLPEESRRADLDALRARLAEHIGWNKALDYPTTHITMVYDIQDAKNDAHPIDRARLQSALDRFRGDGPVRLRLGQPDLHEGKHLLMPIEPSDALTALRHSIVEAICVVVAEPVHKNAERVANVKEQRWPHLTLAQDITADQARKATNFLADHGRQASLPLQATEIALLARDLDVGDPYRLIYRIVL